MARPVSASLLRRRVVMTYASLAVVICIGSLTALVTLDSASRRSTQTRAANQTLAELDELRAAARLLARTVRRYLVVGNSNDRTRAHSIADALGKQATRSQLPGGTELRRELDAYATTVLGLAAEPGTAAPLERLARFENELERGRTALDGRFGEVAAIARSRRSAPSIATLASRAYYAVIAAGALGLLLAAVACRSTLQALRRSMDSEQVTEAALVKQADLVVTGEELRAPLEALLAEIGRLRLTPRDRLEQDALDAIARNATRMNTLLAELLDAAALQGSEALHREPCDAAALADRAVRDHRDLAFERSVRLRYEAALSRSVNVDRVRIRHVLGSLLELAILETRPGGCITLRVAAADDGIRFAVVSDQPDATGEHTSDMVLKLCNRVVAAHGGQLDVQGSAVSRTYGFTIPAEPTMLT